LKVSYLDCKKMKSTCIVESAKKRKTMDKEFSGALPTSDPDFVYDW